jgi:hypothetical protein
MSELISTSGGNNLRDTDGNPIPLWKWGLFAVACAFFPPLLGFAIIFVIIAAVIWVIQAFFD